MATTTVARGPAKPASRAKRKAPFPVEFYRSAVGKKYVMAITGIVLMGYVFAHMVGNLKMYQGMADFDAYAEFLRRLAYPLLPKYGAIWLLRGALIVAVVLHIHAAYALTRMNQGARTVKYQSQRDYIAANFASRSMRWTGIIVGLFIIWHLLDLTVGAGFANPDFASGAAYQNTVASLSRIPIGIFYVVANLALGVHLFHGAWSLFQSMGWNNPRFNVWRRNFAAGFAAIIVIGNVSFPVAIMTGIVS
jgi:succinate dehydrogenase / fumarate reductase, cytochrome b subunit